jgi:hypothetical protein
MSVSSAAVQLVAEASLAASGALEGVVEGVVEGVGVGADVVVVEGDPASASASAVASSLQPCAASGAAAKRERIVNAEMQLVFMALVGDRLAMHHDRAG